MGIVSEVVYSSSSVEGSSPTKYGVKISNTDELGSGWGDGLVDDVPVEAALASCARLNLRALSLTQVTHFFFQIKFQSIFNHR